MTKAVFVPDLKEGYWSGEFGNSSSVKHEQLLDDDRDAILQGQLEMTMNVNQKALLQDLPAETCGVSMSQAEAKLQEEMKRKLAAEAAKAEENDEDMVTDQGPTEAKKRKVTCEDDEEEIGEDEEMLLAQAVSLGNDEGTEGSESAAAASSGSLGFGPGPFNPMLPRTPMPMIPMPMTPMPMTAPMTPGVGGVATKATVTKAARMRRVAQQGAAEDVSPVASATARGASSPATGPRKMKQARVEGVPLPQPPQHVQPQLPSLPVPSPSHVWPAAADQAGDEGITDGPDVADMEQEQTQSTWNSCVRVDSLKLSDPASDVYKRPASLKKSSRRRNGLLRLERSYHGSHC